MTIAGNYKEHEGIEGRGVAPVERFGCRVLLNIRRRRRVSARVNSTSNDFGQKPSILSMPRWKLSTIIGITALSSALWSQSPSQGIQEGEYEVISPVGQNGQECCVDRDSNDRGSSDGVDQSMYDLQFLRCNATVYQRFSIGHSDARGCYQIWSVADGIGVGHRARGM
jgi:hypothetical protein